MMRQCWLLVSVCALFFVQAQAAADDGSLEQARGFFDSGQSLYQAGKFEEAATAFGKAYEARPYPQFLFNAGACQEQLRNYPKAVELYRKYLASDESASDRNEIQKRIEVLEKEIARQAEAAKTKPDEVPSKEPSAEVEALGKANIRGLVVIESDPPGASIFLNDKKSKALSTTPWNGSLKGTHTVYVELDGHKSASKRISADPKRLTVLVFSMAENEYLGFVNITSNVPGANIYVDDKTHGSSRTTPWEGHMKPGKHKIWVTKDGYDEYFTELEVGRGKTHTINAPLKGGPVGYVQIRGDVDKASLYVDGKLKCERGPCRISVPQGQHTVTVKREGHKPYSRSVNVAPNSEVTLKPTLAEKPARVDAIVAYTLAAGFLGTSIWAGVKARGIRDDLQSELEKGTPPLDPGDSRFRKAKFFSIGADAALAIGGVSLVAAIYYTFRDKGAPSTAKTDIRTLSVTPQLSPEYAGVGMGVTF